MAQILFDFSSRGGLVDNFYGDKPYSSAQKNLAILGTDQQYTDGVVNPFSKYGYLTPANNTKRAFATASDKLLSCGVVLPSVSGDTPYAYFGEFRGDSANSKVYRIETATGLAFNTSLALSNASTYPQITDLEVYEIDGTRTVFASWRSKASTGVAGITSLASDLSTSTNISTTVGSVTAIRLISSNNSYLYVLGSNSISKFDGTDTGGASGLFYQDVLQFLGSFDSSRTQITSIGDGIEYRDNLWIGLNVINPSDKTSNYTELNTYSSVCGVYVWNKQTTTISANNFFYITGARQIIAMVEAFMIPFVFTIGDDGYTELRAWNGSNFEIVHKLGKSAFPRFHDSISVSGNIMTWFGNDGILYAYGKIDSTGYSLHKIGDFTSNVATGKTFGSAGAILLMNGTESNTSGYNSAPPAYYVSYTDSDGTAYTSKFYPFSFEVATVSQYPNAGNYFSLVKFLPKLSQVDRFTLFFPKSGSGGSTTVLTMNLYYNQSATASKTVLLTQDDLARGYKNIEINKSNINALQVGFVWSTAIALKDTITPSHGILEYTTTGKII